MAGARIDLRPTPPVPPGGYEPNTIVHVDVYFVDTGTFPFGNIEFRSLFLDFEDSSAGLIYPGADSLVGTDDDHQFNWQNPVGVGVLSPELPYTSWIFPLASGIPFFQIVLPDNGEVLVGDINVIVGDEPGMYVLDVMNSDAPTYDRGAFASFSFNPWCGDLDCDWSVHDGDLTGGVLELPVVPEPGTLILVGLGLFGLAGRRTRRGHAQRRQG